MSRKKNPLPRYEHHKPSGQAYVRIPDGTGNRKTIYLGKYDSPESKAEYRRITADIERVGQSTAALHASHPTADLTVNGVIVSFMEWATTHYRTADGKSTTEIGEIKSTLRPLKELFGDVSAAEFGPRSLASLRQHMIGLGWCRTLINRRIKRVRRMFRWAASEELVHVTVYQALRTLKGLQKGRTEARESKPVKPVDPAHVAAVLPHLNRHVRAMVELEQLTGMRPGEVCKLTFAEVERSGSVWVYRPAKPWEVASGRDGPEGTGSAGGVPRRGSSTDHPPPAGWDGVNLATDQTGRLVMADAYQEAGRERDANLLRDLTRPVAFVGACVVDPAAVVFSPIREREERFRTLRANRKSKLTPSQQKRRTKNPERQPGVEYHPHAFAHAIAVACEKAGIADVAA